MLPTLILLKSICRFFRLLFLGLCLCVSCIEFCARCVTSFARHGALEFLSVFVYFCPRLFLFCSKREQTRESSCVRLYCSVVLVGCWFDVGLTLMWCRRVACVMCVEC